MAALLFVAMLESSAADRNRPPATDGATKVEVSAVVLDLTAVNDTTQSFSGNIFFEARWHDPRLAHDGAEPATMDLEEVWHPRLGIVNVVSGTPTLPEEVRIDPDGWVSQHQRVIGTFSQPLHLRNFPFDRQRFDIRLVSVGYGPDAVSLVPVVEKTVVDSSNWALSNWALERWSLEKRLLALGRAMNVETLVLEMQMARSTGYFILKMILPLVLIVSMSWIVFWISPQLAAAQVSVAVTSMLTLIAYRFMIDALVPRVSYLTRLDHFILGAMLLVFITLIEAVVTIHFAASDRLPLAMKIDRSCRLIMPAAFVGLIIWSLVL